MNGAVIAKVAGAVVTAAVVLVLATLWHDSPWSGERCAGDCWVEVSNLDYSVKVAVALLSLLLAAAVTSRVVARRKVLAAAMACAASGAIAVFILSGLVAYTFGNYRGPDSIALITVSIVTGIVGALEAWCVVRWWPNTSLERTREG
jgi:hypothetical protein